MKKSLMLSVLIASILSCTKKESCKAGFTGDNCDEQITPRSITINSIVLTAFKQGNYDPLSGPDLYLIIKYGGTEVFNGRSDVRTDVRSTDLSLWITNIDLKYPLEKYTFEVWDYDSPDDDDYIGGITGTIYSPTNKFPTSIDVHCSSCDVSFILDVNYNF